MVGRSVYTFPEVFHGAATNNVGGAWDGAAVDGIREAARVGTQPRREHEQLCLPTRMLPLHPKAAAVSANASTLDEAAYILANMTPPLHKNAATKLLEHTGIQRKAIGRRAMIWLPDVITVHNLERVNQERA